MIELEPQILGVFLQYPEALRHAEGLQANHFAEPLHGQIFSEILALAGNGELVSLVTVAGKLGPEARKYLAACVAAAGSVLGVRAMVEALILEAARQEVLAACREAMEVLERGGDVPVSIAELRARIDENVGQRGFHHAGNVTESIIADLSASEKPASTGFDRLDKAMDGGLMPGKAYGFAARKKIGKTILAATISHNLNKAGCKHLFICGEMGEKEIHQRNLARELDLYPSAWRNGYAKSAEVMRKLGEWAAHGPKNAIYYDAPGITFDQLKRAVATAVMKHKIQGFILDYWQLVGGKDGRTSTAEHLGDVAQWIAEVCRKLRIWALVTAQINQDGNTRGGEGIRLAFDQVYVMHPENYSADANHPGDPSLPGRWIEMMDTRYTAWNNIGGTNNPGFRINEKGPFFEECADQPALYSAA